MKVKSLRIFFKPQIIMSFKYHDATTICSEVSQEEKRDLIVFF